MLASAAEWLEWWKLKMCHILKSPWKLNRNAASSDLRQSVVFLKRNGTNSNCPHMHFSVLPQMLSARGEGMTSVTLETLHFNAFLMHGQSRAQKQVVAHLSGLYVIFWWVSQASLILQWARMSKKDFVGVKTRFIFNCWLHNANVTNISTDATSSHRNGNIVSCLKIRSF